MNKNDYYICEHYKFCQTVSKKFDFNTCVKNYGISRDNPNIIYLVVDLHCKVYDTYFRVKQIPNIVYHLFKNKYGRI